MAENQPRRPFLNADCEPLLRPEIALLTAPTPRSAPTNSDNSKSEERVPVLWRVFGGTVLSILALVAITTYQSFAGDLAELRREVTRIHEIHTGLVKKDEVDNRVAKLWDSFRDVNGSLPTLKAQTTLFDSLLRSAEQERKELAREVQTLRERVIALEGRQAANPK